MKNPEPAYRKRRWRTKNGSVKTRWMIEWRVYNPVTRENEEKRRSGFLNKATAQNWFRSYVLPILQLGLATPEEVEEHQKKEAELITARSLSFSQWTDQFVDMRSSCWSKSTKRTNVSVLKHAAISFEDRKLLDIKPSHITKFIQSTIGDKEPSKDTIHGRHRMLKTCFQVAVDLGIILDNPCKAIKPPRPRHGRLVYLSLDECNSLLECCKKIEARNDSLTSPLLLKAMVGTALFTGCRRNEIFHLEWADLDRENGTCRVQPKLEYNFNTKSGKSRVVGVNPQLFEILDELRADLESRLNTARERLARLNEWKATRGTKNQPLEKPNELTKYKQPPSIDILISKARGLIVSLEIQLGSRLLFPSPVKGKPLISLPKGYNQAVEDAGLKERGVCFHTLRHTYASFLVIEGVDLPTLQQLMGHSEIKTTMRYAHIGNSHIIQSGAKVPSFSDTNRTYSGHAAEKHKVELDDVL
jgi:integrase